METTEILDTNYNLVDYFFMGGSGPMTILTLFLIGVLISAWKAPNWVRDIGFSSLVASIFWVMITLVQMSSTLMVAPDVSTPVIWGGILCSLLPIVYGLFIYWVSVLISTFQKPRI